MTLSAFHRLFLSFRFPHGGGFFSLSFTTRRSFLASALNNYYSPFYWTSISIKTGISFLNHMDCTDPKTRSYPVLLIWSSILGLMISRLGTSGVYLLKGRNGNSGAVCVRPPAQGNGSIQPNSSYILSTNFTPSLESYMVFITKSRAASNELWQKSLIVVPAEILVIETGNIAISITWIC